MAKAVKLNKTELDRLLKEAAGSRAWVPVTGHPGGYLRPSEKMVVVYAKYRAGAGGRRAKQVAHKIGSYPPTEPGKLEKALKDVLAKVQLGQDPQAARASDRKTLTMAEVLDLYLAEGVGGLRPNTLAMQRSKIEAYLRPALGRIRVTEVAQADVERMRDKVAAGLLKASTPDGKPPKGKRCAPGTRAKGGAHAAAKTVLLLQAIFNFAIRRKLCSENPAKGVKVAADRATERFLSPAELARLGDVLTAREAGGAELAHVAILRLLLLTGCRKNEIAALQWSQVHDGYLRFEDHKTAGKVGTKIVRLGAAAQEVLNKVKRRQGLYVFPDRRDPSRPIGNIDYFWQVLRKETGIEDVRIHDLRHSHASVAVAGGTSLLLVSKLLGHTNIKQTQRYAHFAPDAIQAAADKTSNAIECALNNKRTA